MQVIEAVSVARQRQCPVFYVIREHDPSGIDIERTRLHLFTKGGGEGATVAGTEGAQLVDGLMVRNRDPSTDISRWCACGACGAACYARRPRTPLQVLEGDQVVIKKRFSAFFQTPLDVMLRRLGTERVVLCGVQTPNCIRAAAFDAVSLDYEQVMGESLQGRTEPRTLSDAMVCR